MTPIQRLESISRLNEDSSVSPWLTGIGIVSVFVLLVLLAVINRRQKQGNAKPSGQMFAEYAQKRGLTEREAQLLWAIADQAALQRSESVFTLPTAYDRGEIKLLQTCLVEQGSEESERLQVELSFLREKLGFRKNRVRSSVRINPEDLSSRHIPAGKKLYIRHHRSKNAGDMESVVVKNTRDELVVQFNQPVEVAFGQSWRCRYYSGASLWEFDTSVTSCSGSIITLQHSDEVRLINRRKFLRVPVRRDALVAKFPFTRQSEQAGTWPRKKSDALMDIAAASPMTLEPPEFAAAIVTELGGCGLRVDVDLDVKVNERLIILFQLNVAKAVSVDMPPTIRKNSEEKVIESVAVVRHVRPNPDGGLSIALELTGISDEEIDELIRATNEASIEVNHKKNEPSTAVEFIQDSHNSQPVLQEIQ